MTQRLTTAIIVVAGAALAMVVGPNGPLGGFWRPIPMEHEPTGVQLAGLIGSGLIEAIGVGAALAVLLVGRRLFARLTGTSSRATVAQLTAAWLLGSWWPHTALHMHFGPDPSVLAALEVAFHAGSIISFALLLWALMAPMPRNRQASLSSERARVG